MKINQRSRLPFSHLECKLKSFHLLLIFLSFILSPSSSCSGAASKAAQREKDKPSRLRRRINHIAPRMIEHLADGDPLLYVSVQHQADKVDAFLAHDVRDAYVVIHNLIYAIEGVLLVDDCVEEDAEGPDVLLLAAVGFASEDFGRGVIWTKLSS